MQNTTFNTTSLLKITDDATFIIQCYHTMLGRSLDPFEMRHAIEMLSKGLSRKGFIYWITRSREFGDRFVIEGIASYKLDCYLYKGIEKLLKRLPFNGIPNYNSNSFLAPLHCGRFGFLAEEFKEHDYSFDTEYSALAEGQISQISSYLPNLTEPASIGHLAAMLKPVPDSVSTEGTTPTGGITPAQATTSAVRKWMPEHAESLLSASKSCCFITNPDILFRLLTTDRLFSFANSIEDTFVFTMPQLPPSRTLINIVWGRNWDRLVSGPDGAFCRWMSGPELDGSIHLINHSMDYRHVTLCFTLTVLDVNSEVSVSLHGKSIPVPYSGTRCKVTLRLSLNPGCNTLSFHYAGKRLKQPDASGQTALLSVDNLLLSFPGSDCQPLSGESAYSLDEQNHGSGYYPFLLPDSLVRSQLHRNGFFEISAVSISKTYAVTPLPTTRYDYLRDERHHDCFYILDGGDKEDEDSSFSSVILYIARRTGRFSPESYNYEREEH